MAAWNLSQALKLLHCYRVTVSENALERQCILVTLPNKSKRRLSMPLFEEVSDVDVEFSQSTPFWHIGQQAHIGTARSGSFENWSNCIYSD